MRGMTAPEGDGDKGGRRGSACWPASKRLIGRGWVVAIGVLGHCRCGGGTADTVLLPCPLTGRPTARGSWWWWWLWW